MNLTGGSVGGISTSDSSIVDISGGSVNSLNAGNDSIVTIHARDFQLTGGLSLYGDRLEGTGVLSGEWFNGSNWTMEISANNPTATILAVPEPGTAVLLALGGLALIRKRRRQITSTV